jgi:hypothetical protein
VVLPGTVRARLLAITLHFSPLAEIAGRRNAFEAAPFFRMMWRICMGGHCKCRDSISRGMVLRFRSDANPTEGSVGDGLGKLLPRSYVIIRPTDFSTHAENRHLSLKDLFHGSDVKISRRSQIPKTLDIEAIR